MVAKIPNFSPVVRCARAVRALCVLCARCAQTPPMLLWCPLPNPIRVRVRYRQVFAIGHHVSRSSTALYKHRDPVGPLFS